MDETTLLTASRFRVVCLQQELPNGRSRRREVIRHPGSVVVVPLVDNETICLIRNHRVAVDATLIELPAGTLEPGEDPDETAARELTEETGFCADRIERLTSFYAAPGILDERMVLYRATGLTEGPPAREEGEEIENLLASWDEALEMVQSGKIEDAKTMVGIMYCQFLR